MHATRTRIAWAVFVGMLGLAAADAQAGGGEGPPVFDVPRLAKIAIDGKADDWDKGGYRVDLLMPINTRDEPLGLKAAADHSAACRIGWDDRGLLLLMVIRDDKWLEEPRANALGRYDAVELYMSPKRGSRDIVQWVITPGMDPAQPKARWQIFDYRKAPAIKGKPAEPTVARTRSGDTCTLEILLPWSTFGVTPKNGREVALQVWSRDADSRKNSGQYYAVWHPRVGTFRDSTRMNRIRLAEEASPPMSVRANGKYDIERMQTRIALVGPRARVGTAVSVVEKGRTLATAKLEPDGLGRASATLILPIPPADKPYGALTVRADGHPVETIRLPDPARRRAEAFLFAGPSARPAVFSGSRLPEVRFRRPVWLEKLIGPYQIKTTYFDRDYRPVSMAARPGRYGAVAEITTRTGRVYRRFVTLYRQPEPVRWWGTEMKADITLPAELGIAPAVAAKYRKTIAETVKWALVESLNRGDAGAVLLTGLAEAQPDDDPDDYYSDPWQRNRQWWVGLKRKLYGWEKRWPKPFVCPRPIKGKPAPAVRKGTLAEAGFKPDFPAKLDAVLTAWAKDTDEAFAVCIVRHGVIAFHKAYGTRDGKPMTVETKSWMASTTKMISGACMLMAVDAGLFKLDDPVGKYLSALRGVPSNRPLTIRHCYTHTNGFQWHWGAEANDMEERIAALLPTIEVGVRYAYNGTGMNLATKILEAVTGQSLPNFYAKHLLGPLGCENTDIGDSAGGAQSVPLDMCRIGQMLLNKGAYGKMRFMRPETFEKLLPRPLGMLVEPGTRQSKQEYQRYGQGHVRARGRVGGDDPHRPRARPGDLHDPQLPRQELRQVPPEVPRRDRRGHDRLTGATDQAAGGDSLGSSRRGALRNRSALRHPLRGTIKSCGHTSGGTTSTVGPRQCPFVLRSRFSL